MIPKNTVIDNDIGFEVVEQPSNTYRLDLDKKKILGYTDGIEAINQAIYKILFTERYNYSIYSWNYGIELEDLFGKPKDFVYSDLERRITEALLQDDRINSVDNFVFSSNKGDVSVTFTVNTVFGDVQVERMVNNIVRKTNLRSNSRENVSTSS